MGNLKFNVAGGATAPSLDKGYQGPIPSVGAYVGILKRVTATRSAKKQGGGGGDPMLNILVELKAPEGSDAAKFDGYPVWRNLVITDKTLPFVNNFIESLTDESELAIKRIRDAFWNKGLGSKKEADGKIHVKTIGDVKIMSPNGKIEIGVVLKMGKASGGYPAKLEVGSYFHPVANTDSSEDDLGEDGDSDGLGEFLPEDGTEESAQGSNEDYDEGEDGEISLEDEEGEEESSDEADEKGLF